MCTKTKWWKHPHVIKRRIENDIKPHLGRFAVEDVKPAHIDAMLQATVERGAPTVATDILRWTKRIFDYAIKRNIVQYNPVSAFSVADTGGKESPRERALSQAELVLLFETMRNPASGFAPENLLAVKLLLLLAVR